MSFRELLNLPVSLAFRPILDYKNWTGKSGGRTLTFLIKRNMIIRTTPFSLALSWCLELEWASYNHKERPRETDMQKSRYHWMAESKPWQLLTSSLLVTWETVRIFGCGECSALLSGLQRLFSKLLEKLWADVCCQTPFQHNSSWRMSAQLRIRPLPGEACIWWLVIWGVKIWVSSLNTR